MSRTGAALAREHRAHDRGVVRGRRRRAGRRCRRSGMPRSRGSRSCSWMSPRLTSQMRLCPVVVSSSSPSSPRKTSAVAPRVRNTPVMSGTRSRCATPTAFASARAGLHERAEEVEHGRHAELGRVGPGVAEAGVERRGEGEGDAGAREDLGDARRATASGRCRGQPSTSEAPEAELAARLPCLTTGTPDAAATIAAMVETFTVPKRSPPVPTMSSDVGSTRSGSGVPRGSRRGSRRSRRPSRPWPAARPGSPRAAAGWPRPCIDLIHRPRGLRDAEVAALEQSGEHVGPGRGDPPCVPILCARAPRDLPRGARRAHGAFTEDSSAV